MKCLLDLDGVVADFIAGACQHHNVPNPYLSPCGPRGRGGWDIEKHLSMDKRQFWNGLDYYFWKNLPKTPEADGIVALLTGRFGVENICILSSPIAVNGCVDGKREWIEAHFPEFSRQFLFGSAKQFCAGPDRVLIDDFHHNIDKFAEAGGQTFLVPRVWNDDWAEEPNLLKKLENYLCSLK